MDSVSQEADEQPEPQPEAPADVEKAEVEVRHDAKPNKFKGMLSSIMEVLNRVVDE